MASLGGNQRLLLVVGSGLGGLGGLKDLGLGGLGLFGRGVGEFGGLFRNSRLGNGSGCGSRASTRTANHLLNLSGVVAGILLAKSGKLISLLLSNAADLSSLGIDGIRGSLDVAVDELLVGGVDEGNEESDGGANDGKAPVGNELDEIVRQEGSDTSLQ